LIQNQFACVRHIKKQVINHLLATQQAAESGSAMLVRRLDNIQKLKLFEETNGHNDT